LKVKKREIGKGMQNFISFQNSTSITPKTTTIEKTILLPDICNFKISFFKYTFLPNNGGLVVDIRDFKQHTMCVTNDDGTVTVKYDLDCLVFQPKVGDIIEFVVTDIVIDDILKDKDLLCCNYDYIRIGMLSSNKSPISKGSKLKGIISSIKHIDNKYIIIVKPNI
jgi:hypothetical protein